MKRIHLKILQIINIIAMLVLMMLCRKQEVIVTLICILAVAISLVLAYALRCPHCGRWPRKGDFFDEHCPRCGEKYED